MSNKIASLQWCRAIAITSVLAFHLYPKKFPNGYLGVDIFFVISGYLMAMITSHLLLVSPPEQILRIFYLRRFKRIFPNYFVILFYVILYGYFYLRFADFHYLQQDSKWAIGFLSNVKPIVEKDSYFKMTTDFKPLLHTWSLGVEIQFYCIAPIVFFIAKKSNYYASFLTFTALLSYAFYVYNRENTVGFNSMFCRYWQFVVGALTHHRFSNSKQQLGIGGIILMFLVLVFLLLPFQLADFAHVCRTMVTLIGSQILNVDVNSSSLLSIIFCYVGDVSYSVYLIHWPVIIYYKYLTSNWDILYVLTIIIVLSLLQYHAFEMQMQKFSYSVNFAISFIFAIAVFSVAIHPFRKQSWGISENFNLTSLNNPIEFNEQLDAECHNNTFVDCVRDDYINKNFANITEQWTTNCVINLEKSGNKIAVLSGNSFLTAHMKAIIKAVNESRHAWKFSKIYLLSQPGCFIFETINDPSFKAYCPLSHCRKKVLSELKPDLFIAMDRLDYLPSSKIPLGDKFTDEMTNGLSKEMNEYLSYAKNIVFLKPNIVVEPLNDYRASALNVMQKLTKNESIADLFTEKTKVDLQIPNLWTRITWAAERCNNFHLLDFQDLYCNDTICDFYDRTNNVSLYCDPWHLNVYGTLRIIPRLTSFLNTLLI